MPHREILTLDTVRRSGMAVTVISYTGPLAANFAPSTWRSGGGTLAAGASFSRDGGGGRWRGLRYFLGSRFATSA